MEQREQQVLLDLLVLRELQAQLVRLVQLEQQVLMHLRLQQP